MDPQYPNNSKYTPHSPFEEDNLDLRKYFSLLFANYYWVIISVFLGLSVAFVINRYTVPTYKVSSTLVISENIRGSGLSGYENIIPGMEIYRTRKLVANELEILKSFALAEKAIELLDFDITYVGVGRSGIKKNFMYQSGPFYIELDTSKANIIGQPINIRLLSDKEYEVTVNNNYDFSKKGEIGKVFESEPLNFTLFLRDKGNFISEKAYASYYFIINNKSSIAKIYQSKLKVILNNDKGSVLFLSSSGNNPTQEADYLNTIMQVYIQEGLDEKNLTATNTEAFIDSQLKLINEGLQSAESDLEQFRLNNSVIDLSTEGEIIYDKVEGIQQEKIRLELLDRYYDYLLDYVNNTKDLNSIFAPAIMEKLDPLLVSLITNLNDLIRKKEEMSFSVQPEDLQIKYLNSQIISAQIALTESIKNIKIAHGVKLKNINSQLRLAVEDLQKLPLTERLLINMQRQYNVNSELYTFLLKRRAEASLAKAANVPDNKILDYARPDAAAQTTPKPNMNYMLGLLFGIGVQLALLLLMEAMNNKIISRGEIESKTRVPVIANIGHSEKGDVSVFENPKTSIAESFRGLRTNLKYLLREKEQKIIAVTSIVSGEGKTFVSLNLAAIFALSGKKTLIVGLDLRRPKLHKVFNLDNDKGVSTYLINKNTFSEIISETYISNLFIAPSGPVPPNPAELLETQAMKDFLNEAREKFDFVILDTPPFGVVTDSLIVGGLCDANLFIIRQNYSSKEILDLLNETEAKGNIKNIGIVFNDLKMKGYYKSGYRYYNYNYAYRYGYVYGSDYYGKE
ncbi:MAG: polysaccharide biosynthesis tyrosine autokinase [Bacteroidales bacterium]|nr:polysaccharide biosynthesis tyrosine autokinase [Saprospiraceae bacterium]MCF8381566.1 polysaccharide biosynthesis tyrosine autokinase [Bacteroidales bacterium]